MHVFLINFVMEEMCEFHVVSIFDVQLQNQRTEGKSWSEAPLSRDFFWRFLDGKFVQQPKKSPVKKSHGFLEVLIQWEIFKTVKIKIIPFGSMFS